MYFRQLRGYIRLQKSIVVFLYFFKVYGYENIHIKEFSLVQDFKRILFSNSHFLNWLTVYRKFQLPDLLQIWRESSADILYRKNHKF